MKHMKSCYEIALIAYFTLNMVGCTKRVAFDISKYNATSVINISVAHKPVKDVSKVTMIGVLSSPAFAPPIMGHMMVERYKLPDPGEILVKKFVEIAPIEINNWPTMTIIDNAIDDQYISNGYLLELSAERMCFGTIGNCAGFSMLAVGRITNIKGEVLWQDSYEYKARDFNRNTDMDALEADGAKLLREEMNFGAETCVKKFIRSIKGEKL